MDTNQIKTITVLAVLLSISGYFMIASGGMFVSTVDAWQPAHGYEVTVKQVETNESNIVSYNQLSNKEQKMMNKALINNGHTTIKFNKKIQPNLEYKYVQMNNDTYLVNVEYLGEYGTQGDITRNAKYGFYFISSTVLFGIISLYILSITTSKNETD